MILGLATVWLMWVVAGQVECSGFGVQGSGAEEGRVGEWERGEGSEKCVPLLVACDPLLLNQSTLVMTETLAAFLTVLCLFALNRFAADRRPWEIRAGRLCDRAGRSLPADVSALDFTRRARHGAAAAESKVKRSKVQN